VNESEIIERLAERRILVAGHRGMVGSAVVRCARRLGLRNVSGVSSDQVDLRRQSDVEAYLAEHRPEVLIVAAARVGGIHANMTYPAQFIYDNLAIALNTIHAAYRAGVERLLFLGSTCIYPRLAPQPMPEDCLLASALEPTNEAYAVAKIAGLKLCQFYRSQYGVTFHSAMPTNLYGPGDNYHPENSHVLPALVRRFHEARQNDAPEVVIWGSGRPRREFLHVDDLASAVLHLIALDEPPDWVNVGTGTDVSIAELAELIASIVEYRGSIVYDTSKPDGTPRKLCDTTKIRATGWQPIIGLEEGIRMTYESFLDEIAAEVLRCV